MVEFIDLQLRGLIIVLFLEIAPTVLSDLPKENFPLLQIDYLSFIQSIEEKNSNGRQYHYIDLIYDYINELTKHSSTLWKVTAKKLRFYLFLL
jgi:hypothetical protein